MIRFSAWSKVPSRFIVLLQNIMISLTEKIKFIESIFGSCELAKDCKNAAVRCPLCAPSDKNKKKLAIRISDDAVHCWVCGFKSRNLASLIRKFSSSSVMEKYKIMMPHINSKIVDLNTKETIKLPFDYCLLNVANKADPDIRFVYNYVTIKRKLTKKDINKWFIGTSNDFKWKRRAIIPSFDVNGDLNYYVGRACDPFAKPKYDAPNISKTDIIFNELNIDWNKQLVLCEGVFDMFICGDNAVPLLGSNIDESYALFNAIVANNTPVVLALDGDMWYSKTPKIANKFMEYNIDVKIVDTRNMPDPGSVSKEQFQEALYNASNYNWLSSFKNKLESL